MSGKSKKTPAGRRYPAPEERPERERYGEQRLPVGNPVRTDRAPVLACGLVFLATMGFALVSVWRAGHLTLAAQVAVCLWFALASLLLLYRALAADRKPDGKRTEARFEELGRLIAGVEGGQAEALRALQELEQLHKNLQSTGRNIEQAVGSLPRQAAHTPPPPLEPVQRKLGAVEEQLRNNTGGLQKVLASLTQMEETLRAAARPAPAPEGFQPSSADLPPGPRLHEALDYYAERLRPRGEGASVNCTALREAAQQSLGLEDALREDPEKLLHPDNYFGWDVLDRDVYRTPSLPVPAPEMSEAEALLLADLAAEIARYRRHLHRLLGERYQVQPIAVLPGITTLDLNLHGEAENGWVKTSDPDLHLVIYEVVAAGFRRHGQIMRKPQVRYYRYDSAPPAAAPAPEPEDAIATAPAPAADPPPEARTTLPVRAEPIGGAAAPEGAERPPAALSVPDGEAPDSAAARPEDEAARPLPEMPPPPEDPGDASGNRHVQKL